MLGLGHLRFRRPLFALGATTPHGGLGMPETGKHQVETLHVSELCTGAGRNKKNGTSY